MCGPDTNRPPKARYGDRSNAPIGPPATDPEVEPRGADVPQSQANEAPSARHTCPVRIRAPKRPPLLSEPDDGSSCYSALHTCEGRMQRHAAVGQGDSTR